MVEMRHSELVSLLDQVMLSDDPVDADITQRLPEFVMRAEASGYVDVPSYLVNWRRGLISDQEYWDQAKS